MKIFVFNLIPTNCTTVCYTLSVGARKYGQLSQVNVIYVRFTICKWLQNEAKYFFL